MPHYFWVGVGVQHPHEVSTEAAFGKEGPCYPLTRTKVPISYSDFPTLPWGWGEQVGAFCSSLARVALGSPLCLCRNVVRVCVVFDWSKVLLSPCFPSF